MAKKKGHRRSSGFTLPIAVVAGFFPAVSSTVTFAGQVGWKGVMPHLSRIMTGYNPDNNTFNAAHLMRGMGPILLGLGVHKIASKLGINRALGAARIPFVRI
jgi:hypothetical protein